MPALIEALSAFCDQHGIELTITDGAETASARSTYRLLKDHSSDAYAISLAGRDPEHVMYAPVILQKRRFKKKSGGLISKRNQREYCVNGKTVAWNRHKAENQKKPSLEDYMAEYRKSYTSSESDRHFRGLEVMPARRTYTYHKDRIVLPIHAGDIVRYEKHNKIKGNTKRKVFVAVRVDASRTDEPHASYGNGNPCFKMKFCRPVCGGCLQVVDTSATMKYLLEAEAAYQKRKAVKA
jgi:hypothetical protein